MKTKVLGLGAALLMTVSTSGCWVCFSNPKPQTKPHAPTATERNNKRNPKDTSHREGGKGDRSGSTGSGRTETRTQSHDSRESDDDKKKKDIKSKQEGATETKKVDKKKKDDD